MKLGKPILYEVSSDNFMMNFTPYILIGLYGKSFQQIRVPVRRIVQDEFSTPILFQILRPSNLSL